jgi:hypothetical protein
VSTGCGQGASGKVLCGGSCVHLTSDPLNCGACGKTCAVGFDCTSGNCVCPTGLANCGGTCVDLTSDPRHCGACPTTCSTGQVCDFGSCNTACSGLDGGPDASIPTTNCASACVDTQTNEANCGTCGVACGGGTSCVTGACSCVQPTTLCAGVCTNTANDHGNCGACGNVCAAGTQCNGGVCTCSPNRLNCADAGAGVDAGVPMCVDPQKDNANCGGCGIVCSAPLTCKQGTCK